MPWSRELIAWARGSAPTDAANARSNLAEEQHAKVHDHLPARKAPRHPRAIESHREHRLGFHPRGPGQSHWYEEQAGIVPKAMRTGFGSPAGLCFYEGSLLPKEYRGQLLYVDAGPRELRSFRLTPKGAGYTQ